MAKRAPEKLSSSSVCAEKQKVDKKLECCGDRISELPDDVLISILSLLPTMEATRTCVLSRIWKNLWRYNVCLRLDDPKEELQREKPEDRVIMIDRVNFLCRVYCVWESHRGEAIEELSVRFGSLNRRSFRQVHYWVFLAMIKKVQRLNMDLTNRWGIENLLYSFPDPRNFPHIVISSFNSLTSLSLKEVNVKAEILEYFLFTCPSLEKLSVEGSQTLLTLRVAGPSIKLKYLEIRRCFKLQNIEISAAYLVAFKYDNGLESRISMSSINVPNLVELHIHGDRLINAISDHSSYLPQLKSLTLNINCWEKLSFHEFPELVNLKRLVLLFSPPSVSISYLPFTLLLNAAPFLHTFEMQFVHWNSLKFFIPGEATKYPHQCLKVVKMFGYVGSDKDVEFATHLLEIATSLEKVIIDPHRRWKSHYRHTLKASRKRAEQLIKNLPPGAKLVVL